MLAGLLREADDPCITLDGLDFNFSSPLPTAAALRLLSTFVVPEGLGKSTFCTVPISERSAGVGGSTLGFGLRVENPSESSISTEIVRDTVRR